MSEDVVLVKLLTEVLGKFVGAVDVSGSVDIVVSISKDCCVISDSVVFVSTVVLSSTDEVNDVIPSV